MELIKEGLFLMLIGMGSVFAFLVIMLYAMNFCSALIRILNKYFPEVKEEQKTKQQKSGSEAEIALAIACAARRMKES